MCPAFNLVNAHESNGLEFIFAYTTDVIAVPTATDGHFKRIIHSVEVCTSESGSLFVDIN